MKKLVTLLATLVAVMAVTAGTASAGGGGGQVLDTGFACALPDGNGNAFITYDSSVTLYANQQGAKLVLRCEGWGAPASSLTYFNYANTGFSCGVPFGGSTLDWSAKVGRNGNSQLTCTYNLGNGPLSASSGGAGIG